MKKKLFKTYEFELDKNQSKVITSFAKQAIKQMESDDRLVKEVRIFNSIVDKLSTSPERVKFTKEEKTRLVFQLRENTKHLKKKVDNSWFLTKWFYRNMYNQYENIIDTLEN